MRSGGRAVSSSSEGSALGTATRSYLFCHEVPTQSYLFCHGRPGEPIHTLVGNDISLTAALLRQLRSRALV